MLTINLVYDANALAAPQSFRDGVQAATNALEAQIFDPITVNVGVGYGEYGLGSGQYIPLAGGESLGGTPGGITVSYPALRAALLTNETTATGLSAVTLLPNTPSLGGRTSFTISTALAKAFGVLPATAPATDGYIGIPADFTGNTLVGGAFVEEVHALGLGIGASDLSLFSYTSPGVNNIAAVFPPAYFSLDGGVTNLGNYDVGFDSSLFYGLPGDPLEVPIQGTAVFTPLDRAEISAIGFDVNATPVLSTPNITPSVTAPGTAASLTTRNVSVVTGASTSAPALIASVSAPSGDAIASYGFEDLGGNGGSFSVAGVVEPKNTFFYVLDTQLGLVQYVGGAAAGSETVVIDAYDATAGRYTFGSTATITTTSPAAVITGYYQAILGRSPDPGGLAGYVAAVTAGTPYAQVEANLANSPEAQAALSAIVQAELGRPADTAGLQSFTQFLATGGSLASLRTSMASSAEAQTDIAGLYQSALGRPASTADRAAITQYLVNGGSLASARVNLAGSGEAQSDISTLYQAVLGRPADAAGRASLTAFLAGGGALATARANIAGGSEAQATLSGIYGAELGRPADAPGLAGFTQSLGNGGSLAGFQSGIAASPEAQADIATLFQTVLGRAVDTPGAAAATASLGGSGSLAALRTTLATSAEAQTTVTTLLRTDTGSVPAASAVAAGQTQLADGLSLADLNTQTLNLASMPAMFLGLTGGTTAAPATGAAVFGFGPGIFGQNVITGFNPAKDVLQLDHTQFPTLAAVLADVSQTAGSSVITLDPVDSITLRGIPAASLVPADFRFA